MYDILKGMRVVEAASFVAGPSCGLHLLQFGAEVIRIDPVAGGPDFGRWPLAPSGHSLYWEGLNKGKKSVAIDLKHPEGQALAQAIVTAPGDGCGLFVTNHPAANPLFSHEALARLRPDLITTRIMGWSDGRTAVDYTVNCAVGVPDMTGAPEGPPVNNTLPAWDLLAGAYAAFALVSAERARQAGGGGTEIRVPLGELAVATVGNLGMIGDAFVTGRDRPRGGNALYGSFGRDFVTADGRRLMIVALTPRQWKGLVRGLSAESQIAALEAELGVSFTADEGARFEHRERVERIFEPRLAQLSYAEATAMLEANGILWGPYQTVSTALDEDPAFSEKNWLLSPVAHPGGVYPTPGSAALIPDSPRGAPARAPTLGEHTAEILDNVLSLSGKEVERLRAHGIVLCAGRTAERALS